MRNVLLCLVVAPLLSAVDQTARPAAERHSTAAVRVQVLVGDSPAPAGIEVLLFRQGPAASATCGTARRAMALKAKTDASGWAEFKDARPDLYSVRAESESLGWLPGPTISVPSDPVVLRYPRSEVVRALIVDAEGKPAPGARASLAAKADLTGDCVASGADLSSYCMTRSVTAGPDGRVTFAGLKGGTYAVVPETEDRGEGQGVPAAANGVEVTVRLPPVQHTTGRVVTARGRVLDKTVRVVANDALGEQRPLLAPRRSFAQLLDPPAQTPTQSGRGRGADVADDGSFDVPLTFSGDVELYAVSGCVETPKVRARVGDSNVTLAWPQLAPLRGRLARGGDVPLPTTVKVEAYCGSFRACQWDALPLDGDGFVVPDVQPECAWVSIDAGPLGRTVIEKPRTTPGATTDVGVLTLRK